VSFRAVSSHIAHARRSGAMAQSHPLQVAEERRLGLGSLGRRASEQVQVLVWVLHGVPCAQVLPSIQHARCTR
jgi:hypothetical protein